MKKYRKRIKRTKFPDDWKLEAMEQEYRTTMDVLIGITITWLIVGGLAMGFAL